MPLLRLEHLIDNVHDPVCRNVVRGDDLRCLGAFGVHKDLGLGTTSDIERELPSFDISQIPVIPTAAFSQQNTAVVER